MELTNMASLQSDFEPATKHFLLIGFLGMLVGSVVFAFYAMKKKENKMQESILFFIAIVSAFAYYYMWSGYGVTEKIDSAGKQRLVFFARYFDRFFSTPLLLYSISLVANAENGEILMLFGLDLLMVFSSFVGATQLHPLKWIWWTLGVVFFLLICFQVFTLYGKAREAGNASADGLKILVLMVLISWCVYPIVWVLGEEGLEAINVNAEVAFVVLADLVSKIGYGLYLIFAVLPSSEEEGEGGQEKTSLV